MSGGVAISVVMPVYRPHPAYFAEAVKSILAQSFTDFELLIVEDPSELAAADTLRAFVDRRVRHVRNDARTSLVDQLNQGLALSRAAIVARMDGDDVAEPDRFQEQFDYLSGHCDVALCGTQLSIIGADGEQLGWRRYPCQHADIVRAMPRYNALAHPSVMAGKEVLLRAGGYQYHNYPALEDYDLWSRLIAGGARVANLAAPLLRYRIHPGGMKTARLRGILRGTLEIKRRYWLGRMDARARARMAAERMLIWLPSPLVLWLFVRTQYRRRPLERAIMRP